MYEYNKVVTIIASPAGGWRFDRWTGDVASSSSATTTVTMDSGKTVTAEFSMVPVIVSGGGGGGGGGGIYIQIPEPKPRATPRPTPRPTPTPVPTPTPIVLELSGSTDGSGALTEDLELILDEGTCIVEVTAGTTAQTADGGLLEAIEILPVEDPPSDPGNANVLGLAYDFGPNGAVFDQPITITLEYDPSLIPAGVPEEDLVIAYYDTTTGSWIELECDVDPVTNTITAYVEHFTVFAVMADITPAAFEMSELRIDPNSVDADEVVTVTVDVTNIGALEGTYVAILLIDGVVELHKGVKLAGGASETVNFTVSRGESGSYSIQLGDAAGAFEVLAPVGISWALVGGILAVIVVSGVSGTYLLYRRRLKLLV